MRFASATLTSTPARHGASKVGSRIRRNQENCQHPLSRTSAGAAKMKQRHRKTAVRGKKRSRNSRRKTSAAQARAVIRRSHASSQLCVALRVRRRLLRQRTQPEGGRATQRRQCACSCARAATARALTTCDTPCTSCAWPEPLRSRSAACVAHTNARRSQPAQSQWSAQHARTHPVTSQ